MGVYSYICISDVLICAVAHRVYPGSSTRSSVVDHGAGHLAPVARLVIDDGCGGSGGHLIMVELGDDNVTFPTCSR